jgi:hypothetical protein
VSVPASLPAGGEAAFAVRLGNLTGLTPWMPNRFGSQQLYLISASFAADSDEQGAESSAEV